MLGIGRYRILLYADATMVKKINHQKEVEPNIFIFVLPWVSQFFLHLFGQVHDNTINLTVFEEKIILARSLSYPKEKMVCHRFRDDLLESSEKAGSSYHK